MGLGAPTLLTAKSPCITYTWIFVHVVRPYPWFPHICGSIISVVPSYLWFHHIQGSTFTDSAYHGLFSAAVFTVEKYLHVKEPAATAKSLQSCLTLCNLETAAHQAPPSLGFSRQEHWSGLPFPSPMHESEVAQLCPTLREPMDCSLPGSSVHEIFQARVLEWVPLPSPVKEPTQFQIIVQVSPVLSLLVVSLSGFGTARVMLPPIISL